VETTAPAPKESSVPSPVTIAVASSTKWDILVVDDSALNRKMLVKTLRAAGHSCEEAGNGREGVDAVQRRTAASKTPFDVVLMDFVMPVMDGPTAIRTLRTDHGYMGPVIGLTGNAMPADINHFMAHGKGR
jgi:CheY-like chemotaxis protein